jgi:hypothetical protein
VPFNNTLNGKTKQKTKKTKRNSKNQVFSKETEKARFSAVVFIKARKHKYFSTGDCHQS